MALIVESGACEANSNTFISLADAETYATDRGLWTSSTTDDAKTVALLRAADYLNTLQWKGMAVTWDRVMSWPRESVPQPGGAVDIYGNPVLLANNIVPKAVAQAQTELAAMIVTGTNPLAPAERGGRVVAETHTTKAGDIDVIGGDSQSDSYTYADGAPVETYFPAVVGLLRPYLSVVPGSSGARCVEAGRG